MSGIEWPSDAKPTVFGLTLEEIHQVVSGEGLPRYAAGQISDWLYHKGVGSFDEMTNLSRDARSRLSELYEVAAPRPLRPVASTDGTRKYLFQTGPREYVEAAYIPEKKRATLCLSVQVGCKRACRFCMTGRQGLQADLTPGQILSQYHHLPERDRVTNIVFMGMGEPMDNLDAVLKSLEILTCEWGYGLSPQRITVSTVGILPEMEKFLQMSSCRLAVSLHSPFEEERRRIMPVERAHPLREVLEVLRRHAENSPSSRRRVSFEYIMFDGVNDTPRHVRELVRLLHGIRGRVNLIPFHPIPGVTMTGSPPRAMEAFQKALTDHGVIATIRRSRGQDVAAACGLLSTLELVRGG